MDARIESLLQHIGAEVRGIVGPTEQRILMYAEAEDGVASSGLFVEKEDGLGVRFRLASNELLELVYELWEAWRDRPDATPWSSLELVITGTKFKLNVTYPDQFDVGSDEIARRRKVLAAVFGAKPVDYSNPDGP